MLSRAWIECRPETHAAEGGRLTRVLVRCLWCSGTAVEGPEAFPGANSFKIEKGALFTAIR